MQKFTLLINSLLIALFLATGVTAFGQSVMQPTDTVVNYDSTHKPTAPANGVIGHWVRTPRLSWSTANYKPYIYNNNPFRLYFPPTYNPADSDGKVYPLLIFFHGVGEGGTVYDNEEQLYHGGDVFQKAEQNGTWNGYVLCMQTSGSWGPIQLSALRDIIDYMVAHNKVDPFHVVCNGLSAGGAGTWGMYLTYPTYISSIIPMSDVDISYTSSSTVNEAKWTPIWNIHGGLDGSPAPYTATQVANAMAAAGANYTDLNMTTQSHDTWDSTWQMAGFWPFLVNSYCSNPWTLFGRTQFCSADSINVRIGLAAGFQAYQWRKNGVVISGATTDSIKVTTVGTYDARVERNGIWSDWSHTPVVISIKSPTITPPISVSGLMSDVLPGADGKTTVNLQVPDSGYTSYTWKRVGSDSVIGSSRILTVSKPGQYIVSVTQLYGCSSNWSPAFRVVNASGPNPPTTASNLVANPLSYTQVQLNWARNPTPTYPETGFEIYHSTTSGGPYTFVGQVAADTVHFTDTALKPNVKYYYVVRAIDTTAAAALSNEASATTQSDQTPPSAPAGLKVVTTNQSSVTLSWNTATDNVSVAKYYVYVNGAKSYVVTAPDTTFTVGDLDSAQQFSFAVTAVDGSNNESVKSSLVSAASVINGFTYSLYNSTTSWSKLPDFTTLTPVLTGKAANVNLTMATQSTNYGVVWKGYIKIPTAGTYYFQTTSDDGSAFWFNTQTATATSSATVNNDYAQSATARQSAALTLTPGVYPVLVEYFQATGGASMVLSWKTPGSSAYVTIPDSSFTSAYVPAGTAPKAPVQIKALATAYNKVDITWVDSSNNETGFEIYRSTSLSGSYSIVTTTSANVTSFVDSTVAPSTTYYYKVQAVNLYGASGFDPKSLGGITYSYYSSYTASNLATLPTLTPSATGVINNVSLSPATATTNFAFKYAGSIKVPATGTYTFYTASDDGSDLYIGGFDSTHLVVRNDFLQGTTERSGTVTLTAGSYPFYATYFQQGGSYVMTTSYAGPGITKAAIPDSAFANANMSTKTPALPAAPSVPYSVAGTAISSSAIAVSWKDSSAAVTGFKVYRSVTDTSNFVLQTTITGTSYTDTALYANSAYLYRIIAVGAGGNSAPSAYVSVKTQDNLPVISKLSNMQVRYGITTTLSLTTSHPSGGTLTYSGINLPAFAKLVDSGNGSASLSLSPAVTDQNTYNNLEVLVTDAAGGTDTTKFNLVVNNNYAPVLDTVVNYMMNEGDTLSVALTSRENNAADTLTVLVKGVPAGYTLTPGTNGNAVLFLHPNYAAAGVYNATVTVNDNNGLSAVRHFTITVKDKSPNTKIFTRVAYNDASALGLPWNALNGTTNSNLLDSSGNATGVGLNFSPNTWWTPLNNGSTTGNNSGVYPDVVLTDCIWWGTYYGGPDQMTAQVTGLDTTQQYSLTFFANSVYSGWGDNGTTTYTVGSQTVSLEVQNNKYNTVTISNIKPAADGSITATLGKVSTNILGWLNSIVITKQFDDGTAPAGASGLTGQAATGKVSLSWQDSAYNATGYTIWRAPVSTGTFTQIGSVAGNTANSFVDSNITGNTKYLYTVQAYNAHGVSGYSDTAVLTTLNRLPKVAAIADTSMKNNASMSIVVTTVDDPGAELVLTAKNLPNFATFVDNGDGTGILTFNPTAGTVGVYPNITVTAADALDSIASASFNLSVTEPNVTSTYINFTGGPSSPKPWNTLQTAPFAGTVLSNLTTDAGVASGVSLTMTEGFYWYYNTGMQPNNGTTVYPPSVVRNGVYEPTTAVRHLVISGLSQAKQYNFVFFGSQEDGTNGLTHFTINGQTVTLQASFNSNKTVQINGIRANASGQVTIAVQKDSATANNAYISSVVIQAYDTASTLVLNPTDLRVLKVTQTTANLQWQDRSANETSFQVWRADNSGVYAPIATLPAGTTAYSDTKLAKNSSYYYIVRAMKDSTASDYSNVVAVTTYSDAIYVNVTSTSNGSTPWNNLDQLPATGVTWSNFMDSTGKTTSVGMQCTGVWAGLNALGYTTGNNSGVYPDAVILQDYVAFQGQVGGLLLTGLNLSRQYDLTFLASCNQYGDNNTAFIVNGDTVLSDAMYNNSSTVTMYGVSPDANGQISLSVAPYKTTSGGGWINAMVIQGYTPSTSTVPAPPVTMVAATNRVMTTATRTAAVSATSTAASTIDSVIRAYPNPFQQSFTLQVPGFTTGDKVVVTIYNMAGQEVYAKEFDGLIQGENFLSIAANGSFANSGVYFVRVAYPSGQTSKTLKVLKK